MSGPAYRRVLLKLSGEALMGEDAFGINRDTLDMFEEEGADPALIEVLRKALGEREEMEVEWRR